MNTLKPLVYSENLSKPSIKNFKLDVKIINEINKGTLNNKEFCKDNNISSSLFAGRRASLVKRGHLAKKEISKLVKKENSKPTNSYTNSDGFNKEIARNKMVKYINDADKQGVILSLPFSTATIEKKILVDAPSTKFIGVECDKQTYLDLQKTVRKEKLPITPYFGKLSDKIYGESKNTYSHVIADYCGGLGRFAREIEYAVKNKIIVKGGIMALTFSKPIRGGKDAKELLKLGGTISNNPNDSRCASDKAFEAFFYRIIGNDFDFLEIFNYKDTKTDANGHGFPMVLIVLKRKS